jgi:hypothetical protein
MAVLKVLLKCDICGRGHDAQTGICLASMRQNGEQIGQVDMCNDCRMVFYEMLEKLKKLRTR